MTTAAILRALRLVHGRRVRQRQRVQLVEAVLDRAVVEADRQRLRLGVDALDDAACRRSRLPCRSRCAPASPCRRRAGCARRARRRRRRWSAPPAAAGSGCPRPAHPGAWATAPGSRAARGRTGAAGASSPDRGSAPPRAPDRPPPGRRSRGRAPRAQLGQVAVVDAVGVDDDQALGRLAEDLGQPHDRDGAAGDHVAPAPCPVRPTAADRRRPPAPGASTAGSAPTRSAPSRTSTIDASSTITHVRFQRARGVAREARLGGPPLEQAVQRRRRHAGRVRQPLGGAPRRRRERDRDAPSSPGSTRCRARSSSCRRPGRR